MALSPGYGETPLDGDEDPTSRFTLFGRERS